MTKYTHIFYYARPTQYICWMDSPLPNSGPDAQLQRQGACLNIIPIDPISHDYLWVSKISLSITYTCKQVYSECTHFRNIFQTHTLRLFPTDFAYLSDHTSLFSQLSRDLQHIELEAQPLAIWASPTCTFTSKYLVNWTCAGSLKSVTIIIQHRHLRSTYLSLCYDISGTTPDTVSGYTEPPSSSGYNAILKLLLCFCNRGRGGRLGPPKEFLKRIVIDTEMPSSSTEKKREWLRRHAGLPLNLTAQEMHSAIGGEL